MIGRSLIDDSLLIPEFSIADVSTPPMLAPNRESTINKESLITDREI
jgi:hypothetical protein